MSKWFHCIFFIMINISIHTNTFFKICGFARFDPFHHFLKCMLGISRWFHFVFFFHYDENIHFQEYFFQNLRICKIWSFWFLNWMLDISKWFHFFIIINISIYSNTFFQNLRICTIRFSWSLFEIYVGHFKMVSFGFARFDPFHHFLKCMYGISRWFHVVFFF